MNFFYLHVGCMLSAVGFLLAGVAAAVFLRRKGWWFKFHRRMGASGATVMVAGLLAVMLPVSLSGRPHFALPHTWLGGLTISGTILTLTLGFSQFRFPVRAASLRVIHRWSGRLTLITTVITVLSGLLLVGIL